jgi:hypothetical protein
VLGRVEREVLD